FLTLLINYWESLFVKYDDKVELITRVIARAIVVVFLACLTPTVGVLLSIFYTFDGMLRATYKKLKEIKDEEGKFPVLIELAIYSILWLPFVLVYLPLLLL
ncbi:MAG: hypothetical protein KBT22_02860, partial [Bacteroidales bacterium]|nr:hypothetical protein [Candidatus Scybalocola fimicaballi]